MENQGYPKLNTNSGKKMKLVSNNQVLIYYVDREMFMKEAKGGKKNKKKGRKNR